jgi:hypothetical protein
MGCTGRGMPKTTPVMMLKRPVKTSVEARSIEPCIARAIMSGSRVPRSPRAPEISAAGDARSVRTLCRLRRASSEMNAGRCIFASFVLLRECNLCWVWISDGDVRLRWE